MGNKIIFTEEQEEWIIKNKNTKNISEMAEYFNISTTSVHYKIKEMERAGKFIAPATDKQKTIAQQRKEWAVYSNQRHYYSELEN